MSVTLVHNSLRRQVLHKPGSLPLSNPAGVSVFLPFGGEREKEESV